MKKPNQKEEKKEDRNIFLNYRKWNQNFIEVQKEKKKKHKRKREKGGNNPRKNQGNRKFKTPQKPILRKPKKI
jgi:hypothetical protein